MVLYRWVFANDAVAAPVRPRFRDAVGFSDCIRPCSFRPALDNGGRVCVMGHADFRLVLTLGILLGLSLLGRGRGKVNNQPLGESLCLPTYLSNQRQMQEGCGGVIRHDCSVIDLLLT